MSGSKTSVVAKMDNITKQKLEAIRMRTPRYLYRVWSNTSRPEYRVSGGHVGLNTTQEIIPLAFHKGRGSVSAYHLTKDDFIGMAQSHLTGQVHPETEFSSWAASLKYSLAYIAPYFSRNDVYVSIIDTYKLHDSVQIFYVPALDFLMPGAMSPYPHEYLAHGIIEGPAHRAIPLTAFVDARVEIDDPPLVGSYQQAVAEKIEPSDIEIAKSVGQQYGEPFALVMTLAIICLRLRSTFLFKDGFKGFECLVRGVTGLEVPAGWDRDNNIMTDVVFNTQYGEIEQVIKLQRALLKRWAEDTEKLRVSETGTEAVRNESIGTKVRLGKLRRLKGKKKGWFK